MDKKIFTACAALFAATLTTQVSAETIRIAIGHQSKCTDTYSAGIIERT